MVAQGTTLAGRYRLDVRIGAGGMGEVWRGEDIVLARTVAVKVLLPGRSDDPGFAARFQGEARAMATINHPGVVDVYDYGVSDVPGAGPTAYLVMRFVDGEPLDRLLARLGRIAPEPAVELIAQAASALQAVHDGGIVHRDVKPGNLLVRPDGTLVLTDFGIARAEIGHRLTDAGMVLGTAAYCAPEQAEGQPVTPAVDIYALGVVAYECLAGRRPFDGDTPVTIALKHIREDPPPLPPDVPPPVRHLVERALAKDPARRWRSAAEMSTAARLTMRADTGVTGALGPGLGGAAGTGGTGTGLTGMVPAGPQPTGQHPHLASPETGTHLSWREGEPGQPTTATPPPYILSAATQGTQAVSAQDPAAPPAPAGPRRGRRAAAPKRGRMGLVIGIVAVGALLGGGGAVVFNQLANTGASAAGATPTPTVEPTASQVPTTRPARRPRVSPTPRTPTRAAEPTETDSTPTPTAKTPTPGPSRTPTASPSPTKEPAAKKVVPAVINLTQVNATARLRAAGFKVKVDISGEPSDEGCTRVLDQNPAPGTSWAVDRYVSIVVEQGIPCPGQSEPSTPTPTPTG
ncbi:protein kinase [Sphaerisporangium sp. B11E5]|uniref:serine/threonine protein kinase n=1 Tax=Sphaerisporangium sp. B11E5 TaxID=3153563 RepID=UPI00325DAA0F